MMRNSPETHFLLLRHTMVTRITKSGRSSSCVTQISWLEKWTVIVACHRWCVKLRHIR